MAITTWTAPVHRVTRKRTSAAPAPIRHQVVITEEKDRNVVMHSATPPRPQAPQAQPQAPVSRKHDVRFFSRVLDREIRPADVYNLFDNSDQDFDLFWAEVTSFGKLTDLPFEQGYRQRSAQILAAMCDNLDLQDSRRKA